MRFAHTHPRLQQSGDPMKERPVLQGILGFTGLCLRHNSPFAIRTPPSPDRRRPVRSHRQTCSHLLSKRPFPKAFGGTWLLLLRLCIVLSSISCTRLQWPQATKINNGYQFQEPRPSLDPCHNIDTHPDVHLSQGLGHLSPRQDIVRRVGQIQEI